MLRDDWIDASRIRLRQSIAPIHRETALQMPQSRSYRRTYGAFFMVAGNVAHEDLNKRVTSRNSYSERQPFLSAEVVVPVSQAAEGGTTAFHGCQKGSLLSPIASGRSASSFPKNLAVCKTAFR